MSDDEFNEFVTLLKFLGSDIEIEFDPDGCDSSDLMYCLYGVGSKHNLSMLYGYESNKVYCGREYSTAKDTETFAEFKNSVKSILGNHCDHIDEIVYHG